MRLVTVLRQRIRSLLTRKSIEADLDEELRFHIEKQVERKIAAGMPPGEARRSARQEFGAVEQLKEECRDARGVRLLEQLWQDTRYGFRTLLASPGFTSVVVLTLALGIGANTAIFSLVHGVLLKALPYQDESRLVTLWQTNQEMGVSKGEFAPANFLDIREQSTAFELVASAEPYSHGISGEGEPEQFRSFLVSRGFFRLLGVPALHGRTFTEQEYTAGNHHVVVLSYGLWQRRFGGDPSIVGCKLNLRGAPHMVVGVMPPEFQYPPGKHTELWGPSTEPEYYRNDRGDGWLAVIARLRPGVTTTQAQEELNTIAGRLSHQYPETNRSRGFRALALRDHLVGTLRPALLTFLGAVGLVLLIACANVANLLLVRGRRRAREFAVRAALGAGRARLGRQLITENLILALTGAALGVALAHGLLRVILAWNPASSPLFSQVEIDEPVLVFALGICCLAAVAFGAAPLLRLPGREGFHALAPGVRSVGDSSGARRLKNALVVFQIATALTLLTGAGLLVRSFWNLLEVDPGFRTERVLSLEVHIWSMVRGAENRAAFFRQALDDLAALPGVNAAGAVCNMPFHDNPVDYRSAFTIEGRPRPPAQTPEIFHTVVTHNYFDVLGIPLLRGRLFSQADARTTPPVILINETMARRFWPGEDPLGAKVAVGHPGSGTAEVVGIVSDVKPRGLDSRPEPEIYLPHAQAPVGSMTFVLRTTSDPTTLIPSAKAAIREVRSDLPFSQIATIEHFLAESLRPRRFSLFLLGSFAAMALLLAAVGLYGLMSYMTNSRRSEIGLRMALGARRADILGLVVRDGMTLTATGLLLGLAMAVATTHLLSSMLFDVHANDPATYFGVATLMVLVALLACAVPAIRAAATDPMSSLRQE